MADRKSFLLRLDEGTFLALRRWADDDLRSVNAQVEFLLRRALQQAGRLGKETAGVQKAQDTGEEEAPK